MKSLVMTSKWILVLGGLLWAYEGVSNSDLIEAVLGGLEPAVDVIVFGGAAVVLGYHLLTMKGKK